MKVIIAGGRDFSDYGLVKDTMVRLFSSPYFVHNIEEIVSGAARGADALGEFWADEYRVPIKLFPADWDKHGRSAGPIRNKEMAGYADILVAFWDGESLGTRDMIHKALDAGLEVHVYRYGMENMMSESNYPPGAEHDPRAPWNQTEQPAFVVTAKLTVLADDEDEAYQVAQDILDGAESYEINNVVEE